MAFSIQRHAETPAPLPLSTRTDEATRLLERGAKLARIGAWSCDLPSNRLIWTTGVYEIFGIDPERTLDRRDTVALYTEESRALMERLRAEAIERQGPFSFDAEIRRLDGELRWMRLTGDVVVEHGRTVQIYGSKQDVTAERRQIEALRRLADTDALTGLSCRRLFEERFLSGTPGEVGALILFDVDGFKLVNDRYGHAAGDACLRDFALRLAAAFADAPLIARIGGDEFAVVAAAGTAPGQIRARVNAFLRQLSAPILWRDQLLTIAASAGLSFAADPRRPDAEALFAAADHALYAAKKEGRNLLRVAGLAPGPPMALIPPPAASRHHQDRPTRAG